MAIQPVMSSSIVSDTAIKMLVYSDAGVGKTVLAATLPRPVLISAESGLLSISKDNLDRIYGASGLPYTTDIMTLEIKNINDLNDAYAWVTHPDMQQYFDSIAIDSLSEIAEKCLANLKPQHKDPRKAYGEMQDIMIDVIKNFRDIKGKHVYMSAKMSKDKDEVSGSTLWGPSMPGQKLGPQIPYLFDEVFRYQVMPDSNGGKQRVLQTQPGFSDSAKDRSGKLSEFEYPHLGSIINKIKGTQ